MLSHERIWAAIDAIAELNGLSASGLAIRAGLNPTAFNPSKRAAVDGRQRWPSTESVAKVLAATQTSLEQLTVLLTGGGASEFKSARHVQATSVHLLPTFVPGKLRPGFAEDRTEELIAFPIDGDGTLHAYVVTTAEYRPVYRMGDRLVLAPCKSVRRGERLLVVDADGHCDLVEVLKWGAKPLVSRIGSGDNFVLDRSGLVFTARILWASQ